MNSDRVLLLLSTVFLPAHGGATFAARAAPGQPLCRFGHLLFLFSADESGASTERFVGEVAPRLVASLNRATERRRETLHEKVRGRPDWQATQKAQADTASSLRYVCRVSGADYDLPANQYLLYVLRAIQTSMDRISEETSGLTCGGGEIAPRLQDLRSRMAALWREMPPPGAVTAVRRIESRHQEVVRSSRYRHYVLLDDVYARYRTLVISPRAQDWADALRRTPILPPELLPPHAPVVGGGG